MKEGISNIWLIGIIMVFILIFACYITVTINYTAAFKIKNEALSIIEKHKGMTRSTGTSASSMVGGPGGITINVGALQTINLYLAGKAYTAKGICPFGEGDVWYGVPELVVSGAPANQAVQVTSSNKNTKFYYCFARYENKRLTGFETAYYKVRFFYKMEFPALSEFLSVKVEGLTDEIYDPQDGSLYTANTSIYNVK